jgi:diguanylate cyclase
MNPDLHKAINHSEFSLYYQPISELATGKVVAVEALVRFKRRPAEDLLSKLEQSGQIVPFGEWVLHEACKQAAAWKEQGIRVSVNISPKQLNDPGFVPFVKRMLSECELSGAEIAFEITEKTPAHDIEKIIELLHELQGLGIRILIDDFGTGFSSLQYLTQLPLDSIKIARTFVKNCLHDEDNAIIVRTIINMAENLDLRVVAEGVETREQKEFLQRLNCDYIQGNYVHEAAPAEVITSWLREA